VIERASVDWSKWARQTHRWPSIVFTMTVVANFVFMAFEKPPSWVVYSPLPPLFLMLFTGLYMFALPYAAKWRARQTGG
jgi:cellulose synthase/poly-beta-1,6-N-acetylglucosamine synthase-like glycosyltransferase